MPRDKNNHACFISALSEIRRLRELGQIAYHAGWGDRTVTSVLSSAHILRLWIWIDAKNSMAGINQVPTLGLQPHLPVGFACGLSGTER